MNHSVKTTNALKRLTSLFDDGIFTEIDAFAKSAQGDVEVVAGFGSVNGVLAYAFSQDVTVNSGAVSIAQCAKILKVYNLAAKTGCPIIGIYDSNGVKLTEGFDALTAYGEVVKASSSVSGVVPQISVVAGACLGSSALIANMADIVIAVKDADFYITAPSDATVERTASEGAVDITAQDADAAILEARRVISLFPPNNLSPLPIFDFENPDAISAEDADAQQIIASIADKSSLLELKKTYADNVVTALGTVAGTTVGFIGFNAKALCPGCAYKAQAMLALCDAYNIPVITIANADGLTQGKEAQMLIAATKLTCAYAGATTAKISLVTGQSIGSAYIMLAGKGANADITLAWDSAVVSPLDVDSAVAFLYNDRLAQGEDRNALEAEYKTTVGSAFTAAATGAVDDVFAPEQTRSKIVAALDMLAGKRETTIARKHSVK